MTMTLSSLEYGVDNRDMENPLLGGYDLIIGSDILLNLHTLNGYTGSFMTISLLTLK